MQMNDTDLRAYVLANLPRPKCEAVDTDHAIFPEANLQLVEMSANEALDIVAGATRPDGTVNLKAMTANVLMACLKNADTGNSFLQPGDRDALLSPGMSFIQPLALQAMALCGLSATSVEDAKKNLATTLSASLVGSLPTS